MTAGQRRNAILALGFASQRAFARYMEAEGGWHERDVRRWFVEGEAPPPVAVDAWLAARAAAMRANPPPRAS